MKNKSIFIAINGYGAPKDIFTDLSYHTYLVQVFNYLWLNFRNKKLTIITCGGATALDKPYNRTEAQEIARWLETRIKKLKLAKLWKVFPKIKELSALENMLALKNYLGASRVIYFCEKSREQKMKVLANKIFGTKIKVIAIEFDGSVLRYDLKTRQALEQEDLKYSLLALKNKEWRKLLKRALQEKIQTLRRLPKDKRYKLIDKIAREVKTKYYQQMF